MRGTSVPDRHSLVREEHARRIFQVVGEHGPVSRTEIGEHTGLSKPTILNVIETLQLGGLIRSSTPNTGNVGRAPVMFEHDPSIGYVLGVDLGGSKVSVAVATIDGHVLGEHEEPTTRDGAEALLAQLERLLKSVVRNSSATWKRVLSITIGSPGVVGPDGTVDLASNIPGLDALALGDSLSARVKRPVVVENDVNIAALGELARGATSHCRNFVVLAIGTGIGAGIVINRQLVRGSSGRAGEISYMPIGADPRSPDAQQRGALEVAAAGSAVTQLLQAALRDLPTRRREGCDLHESSSAREVYDAARNGDPIAIAVVAHHTEVIAEAILALAATLDPEVVVLAGGIGSNPELLGHVRRAVALVAPFPIEVTTTSLGARAGLIGAVADASARARAELDTRFPLNQTSSTSTARTKKYRTAHVVGNRRSH